ncbi:hypothetical protein F2Q65_10415 [Thiohalocapsa marina]|uniref:Uncharacterized protein n=1 Tax=Thiohalocapsa marina TaxID=424902 RepID=A0A5M8FKD1_9GAMM|nr:hypothetical protein [Thiohalocapsa marina]KAA6184944.1 hypothetical protein F2Q65_10415 [Thiohalocapsa marina]
MNKPYRTQPNSNRSSKPSAWMSLALGLSISLMSSASFAAPFGYAIDGDSLAPSVYEIDFADNSISEIGTAVTTDLPHQVDEVEASSFGPGGVTLFAVTDDNSYKPGHDIDDDVDGTILTDALYTINTTTGAATWIADLSRAIDDPGLAFCSSDQTMYLSSTVTGGGGALCARPEYGRTE